jgi:hypothetical protein
MHDTSISEGKRDATVETFIQKRRPQQHGPSLWPRRQAPFGLNAALKPGHRQPSSPARQKLSSPRVSSSSTPNGVKMGRKASSSQSGQIGPRALMAYRGGGPTGACSRISTVLAMRLVPSPAGGLRQNRSARSTSQSVTLTTPICRSTTAKAAPSRASNRSGRIRQMNAIIPARPT